ncbi:TolC family protein [Flavobacterium davisii]
MTEYELEKAVTLAFYQYLYGIATQKLNTDLNDIYTNFLKNAELRHKTGETGNIEVISAKAKIKEIETQKKQIIHDLSIYQKQLQFFLQTEETIIPDILTPLEYKLTATDKTKVENLVTDYYKQQISVNQKETSIYKALRIPKLGIGYFFQTIQLQSPFQGFTVGLQIPLFGNVNNSKIKASEINAVQSELLLYKNKLVLQLQNQELMESYEKYKKNLEYYQNEGLQYAEQIIIMAQKSYASGDLSYWSYINFLNQAIDIKKQNVEVTNAYNQSAIALQYPSIPNN